MTDSTFAPFADFDLTDLIAIQDALQNQARTTEKFLHERIEPVKADYPSLYAAYQKQFMEEVNRFQKFKTMMENEF
jgi:hypothetical protein